MCVNIFMVLCITVCKSDKNKMLPFPRLSLIIQFFKDNGVSLMAQMVKNPPAVQKTWV